MISMLLSVTCCFMAGQTGNEFTIVLNGQSSATIVIPKPRTREVPEGKEQGEGENARAAEIFQSSVRKMTGAVLPVVAKSIPGDKGEIDIGFSLNSAPKTGTLNEDGFAVLCDGQSLRIVSGGRKGAIYGVVDLLEKEFGCRKFSPTAEFFPRRDTLTLPKLAYSDNPANSFRCVNGDFSADPDYLDWQRLNTPSELFANGFYVHTFNKLVPWEDNFADHPAYYALLDGKRVHDQICPSNPEVLKIIVSKLRQEMAAQPDKKVWSVSQNDNFTYCHCPLCEEIIKEEGSPAGPIIRLVNEVARAFPEKTISTLAYQYSRPAPKRTKPARNVMIMLCTIELNRSKPIDSDPTSSSFVKDIADWSRICRNIYLWDYTVDFSHFVSPFPNLHVLQPNIQFFDSNGVRQIFEQSNTGVGHEFSELKSYLLAKLLWQPDADLEAALMEFLNGYYGRAAPYLRRYIVTLQNALIRSGTRLDIYEPPTNHEDDFLSAASVDGYDALFDQAEAAVAGEPILLSRVKVGRLPLEYAKLQIAFDNIFGPRGFFENRGERYRPRQTMAETLDEFHVTCLGSGVRTLNEGRLSPEEYHQAAIKLTTLEQDGNLAFERKVSANPPPSTKYGKGELSLLTNGVCGGSDFNVQWLGWEGVDFNLVLDLGKPQQTRELSLDTLWNGRSWVLHPRSVSCYVSVDDSVYEPVGSEKIEGDQQSEPVIHTFRFEWSSRPVRFVKVHIEGTKTLPNWHPSAGGKSWVFVDELVAH